MITVVAALIRQEGKVLIAKRSTGDIENFGKWEFPGGKVEQNEEEKSAIEREIKEEFDVEIRAIRFLINHISKYPKEIDLRLYECQYLDGDFRLYAHSEYRWVEIQELLSYDLAPADIFLAEYLVREKK